MMTPPGVLLLLLLGFADATVFPPNDRNLYFSPFAWHVNASSASTINSAAYCRFMFKGSMLNFKFDISNMVKPTSEVYWSVDNGPKTLALVSASVSVAIPTNNKQHRINGSLPLCRALCQVDHRAREPVERYRPEHSCNPYWGRDRWRTRFLGPTRREHPSVL